MSNPDRRLVTVRRIDRIESHPHADRLELARIGGWQCVVGKGEFSEGQLVLYFEPDSFLPLSDPRFAFLRERGVKTMSINHEEVEGHVLRTIKLRGEYSQGLVLDAVSTLGTSEETVAELCAGKVNLSKSLGVVEYEPIRSTDQGNMHILRRYDAQVAPRTDAVRIQNVGEDVFAILKKTRYFVSIKVDGTSITMLNDPRYQRVRVFSHNNELSTEAGFGKQVLEQAKQQGIVTYLNEHPGITMQMEAAGPKINGNRLGLKAMRLFVFSMWDTGGCKYLNPYDEIPAYCVEVGNSNLVQSVAPMLSLRFLLSDYPTTLDLIDYVDGLRGHVTDRLDEGIVIHCIGRGKVTDDEWYKLQVELGAQMQVKCISRAYMAKAKG